MTADRSLQQSIFEKTLIEVGSSHLYASFGIFCVQIGQLFEAQWDLKFSEKFEIYVILLQKQRFYLFQTFFKQQLASWWKCLCNENIKKQWSNFWIYNFSFSVSGTAWQTAFLRPRMTKSLKNVNACHFSIPWPTMMYHIYAQVHDFPVWISF